MLRRAQSWKLSSPGLDLPGLESPWGWFRIFLGLLINSDEDGFSLPRMRFPHLIDGSTDEAFPGSFRRGDENTALESCISSPRLSLPHSISLSAYLSVCTLSHRHTGNYLPPHRRTGLLITNPPHPKPSAGQQLCPGTEEGQGQGAQLGTGCFRTLLAVSAGEDPDGLQGAEAPRYTHIYCGKTGAGASSPRQKNILRSPRPYHFPVAPTAPAESSPGQVLSLGQFPNRQQLPLPPLAASLLPRSLS